MIHKRQERASAFIKESNKEQIFMKGRDEGRRRIGVPDGVRRGAYACACEFTCACTCMCVRVRVYVRVRVRVRVREHVRMRVSVCK